MENWGADETVINGTPHDPGADPDNEITGEFTFPNIATVANDFHVYAMEWEAEVIRFYVDGKLYVVSHASGGRWCISADHRQGRLATSHLAARKHPFYMLLNLAIDSDELIVPTPRPSSPACWWWTACQV